MARLPVLSLLAGLAAAVGTSAAREPASSSTSPTAAASFRAVQNTTYTNPILPGFHPDPSCIHVADSDGNAESPGTFYCVSSSFSAFPGIPIHASRDLQRWTLIGHVINRAAQLPELAQTSKATSGIWAPTLRYHDGTFYVVTIKDELPQTDARRWENLIFQADDLYDASSWTDPVRFEFVGYDPSPFWDDDDRSYIVASHAWQVKPGIQLAEVDLDSGETGNWTTIWTGTGGLAPEGPHLYRKDGYYYLLIAEGGTGLGHEVTMARSTTLAGGYVPHPGNPVLTNANTTQYFQTVGHADLVQDAAGRWWGVALATRSGPAYVHYPMGRETVLTSVQWGNGNGNGSASWPLFTPVRGTMSGPLPPTVHGPDDDDSDEYDDDGGYTRELTGDDLDFAAGRTTLPPHFTYWRPPVAGQYEIVPWAANATSKESKASNAYALRLRPSRLNLTGLNGNDVAGLPGGQTFVGRRQQHTLFTFRIALTYQPTAPGDEAGVSVFLTQNHHLDLGVVRIGGVSGRRRSNHSGNSSSSSSMAVAGTYLRFRGIATGDPVHGAPPAVITVRVPASWHDGADDGPLHVTLQIQAANATHYAFAAWPTGRPSAMRTVAWADNAAVSYGFTGALLGVYCTSNGEGGGGGGGGGGGSNSNANSTSTSDAPAPVYVHTWEYVPAGQIRE
ncbi:glycoside hydrolase family 43 protein [Niveomyces insectorum RCEF 264]|uniref:Glycoside hydrolase family 43 protein n=1 Tax=Niveomyces insectorum RCEF 264 TaxID=1081102 RepID=A0A167VJ84_9HYPO|nr:glycoside hydrolase family 43 protein [Niveomyces insectorum RCEF 264]